MKLLAFIFEQPSYHILSVNFEKEAKFQVVICKGALAIRRIFSLVDMITKPKFSNCPYVFKIGLFR